MVEISTSEEKTTTKIYNHLVVDSINPLLSLDKLNNQPIFAFQILKARLPGSTQHDQDVAAISVIATIAVAATVTVITNIAINARRHHSWSILKLMQGGVKKRRRVKGRGVLDPITAIARVAAMAAFTLSSS